MKGDSVKDDRGQVDTAPDMGGQGRVLIADDDEGFCTGLERIARSRGYIVDTAADGDVAAKLLGEMSYNAVVSDINMPGQTGIDLLQAIREQDPELPVILITGTPGMDSAIQAVQHRAFHYFVKPFDPIEFGTVLERAIRLHLFSLTRREALRLLGVSDSLENLAALEVGLNRAIESLWIAVQPVVNAVDLKIVGWEALVRFDEPSLESPSALLHAAESVDRLDDIAHAIWKAAVTMAEDVAPDQLVFVNLHPRDLQNPSLTSTTSPLSAIAGRVVLEITERASLDFVPDLGQKVAALRELGFRLAVDDLGAGYSSLSNFANLKPEFVKIDMTLVRGADQSEVKRRIIRSITELCHDMDIRVVAEGVETTAERETLIALGCDFLQGYLLAKPGRPFPTVNKVK